jgi:putative SOS response-associated peptidase YedK
MIDGWSKIETRDAHMCNLYSETKGQDAIRALFRTAHDRTGNLPAFPGIFPDQLAPIVRNSVGGERELVMARWGMPRPPQFGGQPVTNIRNVASPHWRGWLSAKNRCLVPATSFCGDRGAYASYGRPDKMLIDVKSAGPCRRLGEA